VPTGYFANGASSTVIPLGFEQQQLIKGLPGAFSENRRVLVDSRDQREPQMKLLHAFGFHPLVAILVQR
jgi:hypothetical protein